MAKSFLTDIQLNRNVLLNAKIHAWGSAPSGTYIPDNPGGANISAVQGQISSYQGALYIFNGTAWVAVGGGKVTIGNTDVNVNGSAVTTFTGLSSVTSTTFVGALTGNVTGNVSGSAGSAGTVTGLSVTSGKTLSVSNTITLSASNDTSSLNIGNGGTLASGAFANIGLYAPLAGPTFTGTVSGITAAMVGLGNVTNESKATMFSSPTFTGTVSGVTATHVGLGNVTNESKATMFTSPTFTGTVAAFTSAGIAMGNNKITGLATPTEATDAATKGYVDTSIANTQAGFNVHTAVVVASTANITGTYTPAASPGADGGTGIGATFVFTTAQIDGVTLAATNRVLLKNQTDQKQNGIYTVTGTPGANVTLTRATDFDNSVAGEVFPGDLVYVTSGTANGGSTWAMNSVGTSTMPTNAIKIGTDNIVWVQFAGTTGGVLSGANGGTGVANTGKTITVSGNTTIGSSTNTVAFTTTGNTSVELPTTGILATRAGSEALTNKSYNGLTVTANGTNTLNIAAGKTLTVSESMTLTSGLAGQIYTLPSSTATLARTDAGQTFTGVNTFTSPSITTSLTTGSASFDLVNTTATTVNFAGAATTLNLGGDISSSSTINLGLASNVAGGATRTINIGTGASSASGVTVNIATSANTSNAPVVNIGHTNVTTTITGAVRLPTVGTSGFAKLGASGALSAVTTVAQTDMATSTSTATATAAAATGNVTNARKAIGVGIGTGTAMVVNHGLGQWVTAQLYDTSGNLVEVDVLNASTSGGTTTFTFASSQTLTGFQYVIVG